MQSERDSGVARLARLVMFRTMSRTVPDGLESQLTSYWTSRLPVTTSPS